MARDRYPQDPDKIEIVNDNFSTEERKDAADELLEHWPKGPKAMSEDPGTYSSNHYERVRKWHLGPKGTGMTFEDIRDKYGSVNDWMKEQRRAASFDDLGDDGQMIGDNHSLSDIFSDHELDIFRLGLKKGRELERSRIRGDS